MGQLLDYGYRGRGMKPKELIAVGEPTLDEDMQTYIDRLRKQLGINLKYRQLRDVSAAAAP